MAVKKKKESWKEYLARVETPRMKKLRKLSFWCFAVFYVCLVAALVYGASVFLDYCNESFIMYENSQISLTVDEVMAQLNSADAQQLSQLLSAPLPQTTEFDDAAALLNEKYELLAAAELSCKELPGYDAKNYNYALYAGGQPVGSFSVTAGAEEVRLGLLTITDWQYSGGQADFTYDSFSRSYTVPQGFSVSVNGILLGEEYAVGEVAPIDTFEYVAAYTDMPGMITYTVDGLVKEPQVEILDNLGRSVAFDSAAEQVTLAESYNASAVPAELEEMIIGTAKLWANYSLRDAELSEVKTVLIKGSMLYQQVEDSNHDRRYIDRHELIGYENEQILEYISYSDVCFSCRVYMERTVKVESTGAYVTDNVDNIFYFVYIDATDNGVDDPGWYIADMW